MPPDAESFPAALAWLNTAQADLVHARGPLRRGGRYEFLCFHAQQAAEKALKAVLILRAVAFARTHDLVRLADLLPQGTTFLVPISELAKLAPFAVAFRYPADMEPVTRNEHRHLLAIARDVVRWAAREIGAD
jgi:HEPN domain-containing protein